MADEQNQIEIPTPLGPMKASGRDIKLLLIVVTFGVSILIAWILYRHAEDASADTKSMFARFEANNGHLVSALKDLAKAQREMACVIALPPEKREREYSGADSYCRRLSNMQ